MHTPHDEAQYCYNNADILPTLPRILQESAMATASHECIFRGLYHCKLGEPCQTNKSEERLKKIIQISKQRFDGISQKLAEKQKKTKPKAATYHKNCVSRYLLKSSAEEERDEPPVKKLRPLHERAQHCLFCGQECHISKNPKNPNRWREAYQYKSASALHKEGLLRRCHERQDKWGEEVQLRLSGALVSVTLQPLEQSIIKIA